MAGYIPDKYIGSAPEAKYILIISENRDYEEIIEEFNLVSAMEYADSMGTDLANVSLGYGNLFDHSRYDHPQESMDGHTHPSSIGAGIATSRGMIIVTSAGNSGDIDWMDWIGAPGDSQDVIAVGSINLKEDYTHFSSKGFVEAERIKPDITSVGFKTCLINTNDSVIFDCGTSFSSPLMAGLITCFWQKFHDKTSTEIRNAIFSAARPTNPTQEWDPTLKSGTPNIYTGRGIVDFNVASNLLTGNNASYGITISLSSTSDIITISIDAKIKARLNIFSTEGQLLNSKNISNKTKYDFSKYPAGKYIVRISIDNNVVFSQIIIKQ